MKITRRNSITAAMASVVAFFVSPLKGQEASVESESKSLPDNHQRKLEATIGHDELFVSRRSDGLYVAFMTTSCGLSDIERAASDRSIFQVFIAGTASVGNSPREAIERLSKSNVNDVKLTEIIHSIRVR